MAIEQISSSSTWGMESAKMNRNFQNLSVDVEKAKNASTRNKGLFPSESELKAAIPSPVKGDWAVVGNTIPGTVYQCKTAGTWTNTGQQGGGGEVDLTGYTKETDFTPFKEQTETDIDSIKQTQTSQGKSIEELSTEQTNQGNKLTDLDARTGYVACTTAAGTAAKTVTKTGFVLSTGCRLVIKMSYANTAASPTLNVNNTGAKPFYYNGEVASSNNTWEDGETVDVYYDGTNFYASNVQGGSGSGGNMILEWNTDVATTRKQVKANKRKAGMQISYLHPDNGWINEQYVGTVTTDTEWAKDSNWVHISTKEYTDSGIINILNYTKGGDIDITRYLNKGYGYIISAAVGAVASPTISYNVNFSCLAIRCSYGQKLNITGVGGNQATLYAILDKNKKVLKKSSAYQQVEDYDIYIPIDGYELYVNFDLSKTDIKNTSIRIENTIYKYNDLINENISYEGYTVSGDLVNTTNFITSDFINISLIDFIDILTNTNSNIIFISYFDNNKNIILDSCIKGDGYELRRTISANEMPETAEYVRITIGSSVGAFAHIYPKHSFNNLDNNDYINIIDFCPSEPGIVQSTGEILQAGDSLTNYSHVIIPLESYKNISVRICVSFSQYYPIVIFLRSKEISDIVSIASVNYVSAIDATVMTTAFISDDDIPDGANYMLVNYMSNNWFRLNTSFIRAEKRNGKNDFGRRNSIKPFESRSSRYLRIEATTDDPISGWPADKTEHTASIKIYDEHNSILAEEEGITLSYQGSSTMAYPKKNFRMKFNEKKKFFDFPETKKFNLKAYYLDKSQIREPLVYDISNQLAITKANIMRRYPFSDQTVFPTGAKGSCLMIPCELHINGEFWGLYHFGLAKDGNNMLIDEDNPLHFAFEPAVANQASVWTSADSWEPTVHDEVPEDMKQKLQDWIDYLQGASADTLRAEASEHLDVPTWIDYLIVQQVVFGWDGMSNNMVIATYDGGNTFTVYGYDHDNTFGFMNNGAENAVSYADVLSYKSFAPTWIKNFIKAFRQEINARFKELYDAGIFTYQNICNLAYEETRYIPYSVYEDNTDKWPYPGNHTDYTIKDILKWYRDRIWFLKSFFRYYK